MLYFQREFKKKQGVLSRKMWDLARCSHGQAFLGVETWGPFSSSAAPIHGLDFPKHVKEKKKLAIRFGTKNRGKREEEN